MKTPLFALLRHLVCPMVLLLGVLSFTSCEYEPDEIYTNPTNTNVIGPSTYLNMKSSVLEALHISVLEDTEVSFSFESLSNEAVSLDQTLLGYSFRLNGEVICESEGTEGQFFLILDELNEGGNTLHLDLFCSSGTGSIADSLRYETVVYETDFAIHAFKSNKPQLTNSIEHNKLCLRWPECEDAEKYVVSRETRGNDMTEEEVLTCSYFDRDYIGQPVDYKVFVVIGTRTFLWAELSLDRNYQGPFYRIKADENNNYSVVVDKGKFEGAVKTFVLEDTESGEIHTEDDFGEDLTLPLTEVTFGQSKQFRLQITTNGRGSDASHTYDRSVQIGDELNVPEEGLQSNQTMAFGRDKVLFPLDYGTKNVIYSLQENKIQDTIVSSNSMTRFHLSSPNGMSFVLGDGTETVANYRSTEKFDVDHSFSIEHSDCHSVSDTHLLLYSKYDFDLGDRSLFVYDMVKKEKYAVASNSIRSTISANGKYIAALKNDQVLEIHRFTGSAFELLYSDDMTSMRDVVFNSNNEEEILTISDDKDTDTYGTKVVSVRSTSDYKIKSKFEMPHLQLLSVDFTTRRILFHSYPNNELRNLDTGEIVELLPSGYDYKLLNGNLICLSNATCYYLN